MDGGRRSRWARPSPLVLGLLGLALLVLNGCARHAPQDTLRPASPAGRSIQHLFVPVFWIAVGVFVLVQGLLLVGLFRFRDRGGDDQPEPRQVHGNTRLEIGWTAAPALLLLFFVAVPTLPVLFRLARSPSKDAVHVTVVGHQFWWEYRYTDLGVVTANELHFPAGRDVSLRLDGTLKESPADVIHGFWVPRLNGKRYMLPGRVNRLTLHADHPGIYLGQCTEFCGLSHANMRLQAIAQTEADFARWVDAQRQNAPTPTDLTSPAGLGYQAFESRGCAGCHTVNGYSKGMVGPNLTHIYSRNGFAGEILTMSGDNLRRWLKDPPAVKPGSRMPNLKLSDQDINNLVAYLQTLR
ncbi:MAG: cytochrome c oxidase subunit II [Acidimicrobiales bacterium]